MQSLTVKRTIFFAIVAICSFLAVTSFANAASPRPHRGDVMNATPDTFNAAWVTGVSQDGGAKGQSIAMTDFAFYSFRNWWDHNLSDIKKIRAKRGMARIGMIGRIYWHTKAPVSAGIRPDACLA